MMWVEADRYKNQVEITGGDERLVLTIEEAEALIENLVDVIEEIRTGPRDPRYKGSISYREEMKRR